MTGVLLLERTRVKGYQSKGTGITCRRIMCVSNNPSSEGFHTGGRTQRRKCALWPGTQEAWKSWRREAIQALGLPLLRISEIRRSTNDMTYEQSVSHQRGNQ
jgi:hypothetical protein